MGQLAALSLNQPHKQAANLGGITLNMIIVSQKIYDRFWLKEVKR